MRRIVLDTNVLVASAYHPESASRRIVEACETGRMVLLVSPSIRQEYRLILPRAIQWEDALERIIHLVDQAELVAGDAAAGRVVEDPGDEKFLAAAIGGHADALVTNDRHLLRLAPFPGLDICRPAALVKAMEAGQGT